MLRSGGQPGLRGDPQRGRTSPLGWASSTLGSSLGSVPSFDLERFVRDRRRLAGLLEARGRDDGAGTGAAASRATQRLLGIAERYAEVAHRFAAAGEARDLTQLMGWTRQAAQAVSPRYRETVELRHRSFQQFVQVSVLLVVLLEDPGETFHGPGTAELEREVRRAVLRHLDAPFRGRPPHLRPGARSDASQLYLETLDAAFELFWDLVVELCPHRMADPEGARVVERFGVHALREVLSALDFSRRFDALCQGRGGAFRGQRRSGASFPVSLRRLSLDAYLEANQANIFMRCMLDFNFLQLWDHLPAARRTVYGDFATLFREVDRLGAGIERLGNMSNDLATLFREIGEGFVSNFVFADALARGFLRPASLRRSFAELRGRLDPEPRRQLLAAFAVEFFSGRGGEALLWLRVYHPELPATARLLEMLCRADIMRAGIALGRSEFGVLRASFQGSPIAGLIDLDDFWQRQLRFLGQYLGANGLV